MKQAVMTGANDDRAKVAVRRAGVILTICVVVLGFWWLRSPSRSDGIAVTKMPERARRPASTTAESGARAKVAPPVASAKLEGLMGSPRPVNTAPAAPVVTEEYVDTRTAAEGASVPVERDGKFGALYEKWLSEPEDAPATQEATDFMRERLTELELQPAASYLSCRQTLCRMGIAVDDFGDLHDLEKIDLPQGIVPEVTEPYTYGDKHAVVVYWSRRPEP